MIGSNSVAQDPAVVQSLLGFYLIAGHTAEQTGLELTESQLRLTFVVIRRRHNDPT